MRLPPASKPMRLDAADPLFRATVTSPEEVSDLATSDRVRALSSAVVDKSVFAGDHVSSRMARR